MARYVLMLIIGCWSLLGVAQPKANLIGQYLFSEAVIANTAQSPIRVENRTLHSNNVHPISDRYGRDISALSLSHGFVNLGKDPLADEANVTISLWIKAYGDVDPSAAINVADDQYIVCSGGMGTEAGSYITWNNGKINMGRKTAYGYVDGFYQGNVESDRWYMLTMVYDRSMGYMFMFINRGLVIFAPITPGSFTNSLEDLVLGKSNGWSGNYFNGEIDDVHIYNRALGIDEIGELYTANVLSEEPSSTGLVNDAAGVNLKLFPNPATNQVTIETPAEFEYDGLTVSDLTGRTLIYIQRKVNGPAAQTYELPALLTNGLYLVQLVHEGKPVGTGQLTIKK